MRNATTTVSATTWRCTLREVGNLPVGLDFDLPGRV
jgi:hypothetical protein